MCLLVLVVLHCSRFHKRNSIYILHLRQLKTFYFYWIFAFRSEPNWRKKRSSTRAAERRNPSIEIAALRSGGKAFWPRTLSDLFTFRIQHVRLSSMFRAKKITEWVGSPRNLEKRQRISSNLFLIFFSFKEKIYLIS